jgi:hypothetical protein
MMMKSASFQERARGDNTMERFTDFVKKFIADKAIQPSQSSSNQTHFPVVSDRTTYDQNKAEWLRFY